MVIMKNNKDKELAPFIAAMGLLSLEEFAEFVVLPVSQVERRIKKAYQTNEKEFIDCIFGMYIHKEAAKFFK